MNFYLTSLKVNIEISSTLIVSTAKRAEIDNKTIYKLLEDQENMKNTSIRQKILKHSYKKNPKLFSS